MVDPNWRDYYDRNTFQMSDKRRKQRLNDSDYHDILPEIGRTFGAPLALAEAPHYISYPLSNAFADYIVGPASATVDYLRGDPIGKKHVRNPMKYKSNLLEYERDPVAWNAQYINSSVSGNEVQRTLLRGSLATTFMPTFRQKVDALLNESYKRGVTPNQIKVGDSKVQSKAQSIFDKRGNSHFRFNAGVKSRSKNAKPGGRTYDHPWEVRENGKWEHQQGQRFVPAYSAGRTGFKGSGRGRSRGRLGPTRGLNQPRVMDGAQIKNVSVKGQTYSMTTSQDGNGVKLRKVKMFFGNVSFVGGTGASMGTTSCQPFGIETGGNIYYNPSNLYYQNTNNPIVRIASNYLRYRVVGGVITFIPAISGFSQPDWRITVYVTKNIDAFERLSNASTNFVGSPGSPTSVSTLTSAALLSNSEACIQAAWAERLQCYIPPSSWKDVATPNSVASLVNWSNEIAPYRQTYAFLIGMSLSGTIPTSTSVAMQMWVELDIDFKEQAAQGTASVTFKEPPMSRDEVKLMRKVLAAVTLDNLDEKKVQSMCICDPIVVDCKLCREGFVTWAGLQKDKTEAPFIKTVEQKKKSSSDKGKLRTRKKIPSDDESYEVESPTPSLRGDLVTMSKRE